MRSLRKSKARREGNSFVAFPHVLLEHHSFRLLSTDAVKALMLVAMKYRGHNNGNLQATQKEAFDAGWRSRGKFHHALVELQEAGFIVKSRQGGKNRCNLYALTWFSIDAGKHGMSPTRVPSCDWRGRKLDPPGGQLDPPGGQSGASAKEPMHD